MRNVAALVTEIRRQTENEDVQTDSSLLGIRDEQIIQFINDAQDRAQALISAEYPNVFLAEKTFNTAASTEGYTISDRVFLNSRIHTVELSTTGNLRDYVELEQRKHKNRVTDTQSFPSFYIQRAGTILLDPIPSSATPSIRVVYEREMDDLDKRRGKISSVTGAGTSGSPITAITLSATLPTPDEDWSDVLVGDYLCVVDKDGVRQSYNIPYTAYNTGTRVITVTNFVMGADDSLPAADDYVVFGKYSTTHSQLPDHCERYLISYAVWKTLLLDSSLDLTDKEREIGAIERDMISSYGDANKDVEYVPILDSENI